MSIITQAWPTDEQFDAAAEAGTQHALAEIRNGNEAASESPLSGEWAGEPVPADIALNVGYAPSDDAAHEGIDELATAWENAYQDTWRHETEVKAEEDAE